MLCPRSINFSLYTIYLFRIVTAYIIQQAPDALLLMQNTAYTYLKNSPRVTALVLTTLFALSQVTGSVSANGLGVAGP